MNFSFATLSNLSNLNCDDKIIERLIWEQVSNKAKESEILFQIIQKNERYAVLLNNVNVRKRSSIRISSITFFQDNLKMNLIQVVVLVADKDEYAQAVFTSSPVPNCMAEGM